MRYLKNKIKIIKFLFSTNTKESLGGYLLIQN